MNVRDLAAYFAVFPFLASMVFFVLAKEKPVLHRLLASVHGWAALAIAPAAALMATLYPKQGPGAGLLLMLALGAVAAVSVFYCLATVKTRWVYQLLHIPTVLVIALSVVASLLVLGGHP